MEHKTRDLKYNSIYHLDQIRDYENPLDKSSSYHEATNRRARLNLIGSLSKIDNYYDSELLIRESLKLVFPSMHFSQNHLCEAYFESRIRKLVGKGPILDLTGKAIEMYLGRRLKDPDLYNIFKYLESFPNIVGINLSYNNITREGFRKIAQFLTRAQTILYLNVMNNEITKIRIHELEHYFPHWKLVCLRLAGNKFGPDGGKSLGTLLTKNNSLRHLDLGETDQTLSSIMHIVDSLVMSGGNTSLNKLNLSRTLVKSGVNDFCRLVTYATQLNQNLVELILSKNEIGDHDFEILVRGLDNNKTIVRLNMACNRISCYGLELLTKVLPSTEIKILVLYSNIIGDDGATALGRIYTLTNIKYLDLSWNKIGDIGITNLILAVDSAPDGLMITGNCFTTIAVNVIYGQIRDLLLPADCLDITIVFNEGKITYAPKNIKSYSYWHYNSYGSYEENLKEKKLHCCCPIRGHIIQELRAVHTTQSIKCKTFACE